MEEFEKGFKAAVEYLEYMDYELYNEIMGCHNSPDRVYCAYENNYKTLDEWVEASGRNM